MTKHCFFKRSEEHEFGIAQEGDAFTFLVPDELYIESKDLLTQAKTLCLYSDILFKYYQNKKQKNENFNKNIDLSKVDKNFEKLQSLITLFNDFTQDDIYRFRKKVGSENAKRINWSKVFQSQSALFHKNKVIHTRFISENKVSDESSEFMMLYYYALNISVQSLLNTQLFDIPEPNYSMNHIKHILNKFLDENYGDRDVLIAQTLKSFYLNGENNLFSNDMFKTPYHEKFEHIWEFMIESIIPSNDSKGLKQLLQNDGAYYNAKLDSNGDLIIEKDKASCIGLSYKVDHLYYEKDNSFLAILDSKFYDFHSQNEMKKIMDMDDLTKEKEDRVKFKINAQPKTDSIGKQANYANRLRAKMNVDDLNIKNFFVFPKHNKDKNIELFSIHVVDAEPAFNIYCIAIDVSDVIQFFSKSRKMTKLKNYIKIFENKEV